MDNYDNLSHDTLIVTLNQEKSFVNKEYDVNDFALYGVVEVEDLTKSVYDDIISKNVYYDGKKVIGDIGYQYFDINNYRRSLLLKFDNDDPSYICTMMQNLSDNKDFEYVQFNRIYKSFSTNTNDTDADYQWALSAIQLYDAWDLSTGSTNVYIGVCDSGITRVHEDLRFDLNVNSNGLSNSYTGVDNDNAFIDNTGHGTAIAGIIGAITNNYKGISGVVWNSTVLSLKVTCTSTTYSSTLTAVVYNNANVAPILNVSFGWYENSVFIDHDINNSDYSLEAALRAYTGLVVCAAGNNNSNNDDYPVYPANYAENNNDFNITNVISVGSFDSYFEKSSFSNYGENTISIYAPGSNIYSTKSDLGNYNLYDYYNGTSFSAPYVCGVAALILSVNSFTGQQLKSILINSAAQHFIITGTSLNPVTSSVKFLNAYNALMYVSSYMYTDDVYITSSGYNDDFSINPSNISYRKFKIYTYDYDYYKISLSSTNAMTYVLYDSEMDLVNEYDEHNYSSNNYFILNFEDDYYYLLVYFNNSVNQGYVNLDITNSYSNTLDVENTNDVLLNYYYSENNYYFQIMQDGFYEVKINSTNFANNSIYMLPSNSLAIYQNSSLQTKLVHNNIVLYSQNENNYNSIYVYLTQGLYNLILNINNVNLDNLYINFYVVDEVDINFKSNMTQSYNQCLIDTTNCEIVKKINLEQLTRFGIHIISEDCLYLPLYMVIYKVVSGSLNEVEFITLSNNNYSINLYRNFSAGEYYIGFFGNIDKLQTTITFVRQISNNQYINSALLADPAFALELGSESTILHNSNLSQITEGFTRNLYFDNMNIDLPSLSRLDYEWYSNNEEYAIVTSYGTVLALGVESDQIVIITAVYKDNPTLMYQISFVIKNDLSNNEIEIYNNTPKLYSYTLTQGYFKLTLNSSECPYPWIQYYDWLVESYDMDVSMNQFGFISCDGTGMIYLCGHYLLNSRVYVFIIINVV